MALYGDVYTICGRNYLYALNSVCFVFDLKKKGWYITLSFRFPVDIRRGCCFLLHVRSANGDRRDDLGGKMPHRFFLCA